MLPNKCLSFITNNVKGIQSSKKRLKLIQYFEDKIGSTEVLFLQETHSNSKIKQKWKKDFKRQVFFSHEKTNSSGVLTAYFGKETDKEGRIWILDVSINDSEYILINLYNANTEREQIDELNNMTVLLEKCDTNPKN